MLAVGVLGFGFYLVPDAWFLEVLPLFIYQLLPNF